MKAVIMAGGEGTRLRPLTCTCPKPLAKVLGKPVLYSVLDRLLPLKPDFAALTLKYKSSSIISAFPDGDYHGMPLNFVIEDEPLGTAGSVRNAIGVPEDTVLVLSGDAYFEFDLEKALDFHRASGNVVTIVCKQVEDPREYGVVNIGENGIVTGFSEKPGWSTAFSDTANTGIYFLEPSALGAIPESGAYDFAKELFPKLLASGAKIGASVFRDYWCDIGDIESYKNVQFDLLNGKTDYKPPCVAEGIFTENDVPKGDFVLVPPVSIGKNVQIENGAVIGPNTVLGDGCLVSKGAKVRESVLLDNVYISSGCSVNGALVCESVSVKRGASLFEGCAVGAECIIGEEAVIGGDVLIWPKKSVERGVSVSENMKYDKVKNSGVFIGSTVSGDFGVELTPEKAARFGAALGSLQPGLRVGIGIDGEVNALALKCGILGGLISAGAKSFDFGSCFLSQLFYFTSFCELDLSVFIGGGENGAYISLYESGGRSLSRESSRKLEQILQRSEFNRCSGGDCQSVSVMNSMNQMYVNELCRQFTAEKNIADVSFLCPDTLINECLNAALERIGCKNDGERLLIRINNGGTHLTAIEDNVGFSFEKILAVVAQDELQKGNDVALPWDAPSVITTLAHKYGRRIYRFSENGGSLGEAQRISVRQLWSRDALFLAFRLLSIISERMGSVRSLVSELPEFYIAKKVMDIGVSPATISKRLLDGDFEKGESEGVVYRGSNGLAKVKSDSSGRMLHIITEAVSAEAAEELCAGIEEKIRTVCSEQSTGIDNER